MKPFPKANGGIQIMPVCASAGIMRGDTQEFAYHVGAGADLEVLSQSFDKIHKMDSGSASRHIHIEVEPDAVLYYAPQPVIPFAQSAFDSEMDIHLADVSSRFFLQDIIFDFLQISRLYRSENVSINIVIGRQTWNNNL